MDSTHSLNQLRGIVGAAVFAGICMTSPAQAQSQAPRSRCPNAKPDALVIYGDGIATTSFTLGVLRLMNATSVSVTGHDGKPATYRGVPLGELIANAGGATGGNVRGSSLAQYLLAEGKDGYRAVVAYAEADSSFRSDQIIVAYEENGMAIDTASGPVQLVVPSDRRHGRWVRQLECVRVSRADAR